MKTTRRIRLWGLMLACSLGLHAEVVLSQLFQNGMVLQRGKPIPVWGKASVDETVVVTLNKKKQQTTADTDGRRRVGLFS